MNALILLAAVVGQFPSFNPPTEAWSSFPIIAPIPDSILPPVPDVVPPPLPAPEAFPTRIIVGYRKQCINGVCTNVPIYADVPPATPGHTHEELGGAVCRVCGGTCFMLRAAEAAARAKGETSNAAVQSEYMRLYGSGYSRSRIGLFGRRR